MAEATLIVERIEPYISAISSACAETGGDPFVLAGIGDRESWFGSAPGYFVAPGKPRWDGWGDRGYAYGLFQVDRRFHKAWCAASPHPPQVQAGYALRVLGEGRRFIAHLMPDLPAADLLCAAVAAYNAGPGRVFHALQERRPVDSVTTGGDYSLDVLRRAEALRSEAPGLFSAPPLMACHVPAKGAA